jgi:hypothetical protein
MYKTSAQHWPDLRPITSWVEKNFGDANSGRWWREYAGGIGTVRVRWCFRDKQDLDLFLEMWDMRA